MIRRGAQAREGEVVGRRSGGSGSGSGSGSNEEGTGRGGIRLRGCQRDATPDGGTKVV